MTKQSPTPGPWTVHKAEWGYSVLGPGNVYVAHPHHGEHTGEVIKANTLLIAAAPDLLDLVTDFEKLHHDDGPDFHAGTDLGKLLNRARRLRRSLRP